MQDPRPGRHPRPHRPRDGANDTSDDPRLAKLREALEVLLDRARRGRSACSRSSRWSTTRAGRSRSRGFEDGLNHRDTEDTEKDRGRQKGLP